MAGSMPALPDALIASAVEDGIRRYFVARHARVQDFVDGHFSLRGTLRLHRAALGLDILRAPANLLLAAPHAAMKATGTLAGKLGAESFGHALARRNLVLRTDVSRRIEWLVHADLLQLPQPGATPAHDVLSETILADPRLIARAEPALTAIGRRADDPWFRTRLNEAMGSYAATRAAAAEITTSLLTLGSGAMALKQLTPGAVTLGPALAALVAQQSAIASFPFGAGLGGVWYSMFPAAPSVVLVAGLTGGLMVGAACVAAFAGLVSDPVQRRAGLHARRLHRMLDALERQMLDPRAPAYVVHDHYVARLMDLFDLLGSVYRFAHG
jgi:hypothetical protein